MRLRGRKPKRSLTSSDDAGMSLVHSFPALSLFRKQQANFKPTEGKKQTKKHIHLYILITVLFQNHTF